MSENKGISVKELEHYKKIFGVGDVATRAYKAVVKILEQQVDFLEGFTLNEKIKSATKDDPVYERGIKIYEGMPDNILKLNKLKLELNIEYVEREDELVAVSAKAIANGHV
jgi:hypothetical protein